MTFFHRSEINIDDVEEQLDELTRGRAAQNHNFNVKRDHHRLVKTTDTGTTTTSRDTSGNSSSGGAGSADSSTVSGGVGMDGNNAAVMPFDDFRELPSDKQSEEIFRLLSMLSPFASEVHQLY